MAKVDEVCSVRDATCAPVRAHGVGDVVAEGRLGGDQLAGGAHDGQGGKDHHAEVDEHACDSVRPHGHAPEAQPPRDVAAWARSGEMRGAAVEPPWSCNGYNEGAHRLQRRRGWP